MADDDEYSVDSARRAAERDGLWSWVAEFLASPGSDNALLAERLADPPWCWCGPMQLPLDQLNRLAGPSDEPVLVPMDEEEWRDDVDELADKVRNGFVPPPMVATYRDGELVLEDGNHRAEALRRAGVEAAWTIVGFEGADERDRFVGDRGE